MNEVRPDPDQLLATGQRRGRAPARQAAHLLRRCRRRQDTRAQAARGVRASGIDLVIGYVEAHGRVSSRRLLEGLEQLPFHHVRLSRRARLSRSRRRSQAQTAILVVDERRIQLTDGDPSPRPQRWRTSRNCWDKASTSGRPSASSTWKASTTSSRRSPGVRRRARYPTASSTGRRIDWSTCRPAISSHGYMPKRGHVPERVARPSSDSSASRT
jgi:two-component system sensor histidine kinase KdpD